MKHPTPIHTLIELRGEVVDFRIVKISAASQHAAQENSGIDERGFGRETTIAGLNIQKVRKEPASVGNLAGHKAQCGSHTITDLCFVLPFALIGNATRGAGE